MLTSETTLVNTAKYNFNKANGGSKAISIPSPVANLDNAQLEGFIQYYEEAATIGGGVTFKNAVQDKTQRITYKK